MQADICQLGNDQRKVNMLAREYCDATKRKLKPVIVSHSMLPGLKEGQEKMSKSDPESAIFMEDSEADVNAKIKKAFCPPWGCGEQPMHRVHQEHRAALVRSVQSASNSGQRW